MRALMSGQGGGKAKEFDDYLQNAVTSSPAERESKLENWLSAPHARYGTAAEKTAHKQHVGALACCSCVHSLPASVVVRRPVGTTHLMLQLWSTCDGACRRFCHPREEHLVPLFVTAGAAPDGSGKIVFSDQLMGASVSSFQFD